MEAEDEFAAQFAATTSESGPAIIPGTGHRQGAVSNQPQLVEEDDAEDDNDPQSAEAEGDPQDDVPADQRVDIDYDGDEIEEEEGADFGEESPSP